MPKTEEGGLAGCLGSPSSNVTFDTRTYSVLPKGELHCIDEASSHLGREDMFHLGVREDRIGA